MTGFVPRDEQMTPTSTLNEQERRELLDTLEHHRGFLRFTLRDLSDEEAARRTTVSELCLGGLVKHVASVEATWCRFIVSGAGAFPPPDPRAMAARAAGFRMLPGETVAGILERYAEVARATEGVVGALSSLDADHALPEAPWFAKGARWSARRVLLHILAETSQHAGHADILREALDGGRTMG